MVDARCTPATVCYARTMVTRRAMLAASLGGSGACLALQLAGAPPQVVLAAALPAVGWAVVVCLMARLRSAAVPAVLAALLAGAVLAAWPASNVNQRLFDAIAGGWGEDAARRLVPGLLAPVVEEVAKAIAVVGLLWLTLPRLPTVTRGWVLGSLVGLGFTIAENVQYLTLAALQGGESGIWRGVYVRGLLGGLHHATFTAASGVGLALAMTATSKAHAGVAAGVGFVGAVLQHVVWNALLAGKMTDVLCGAPPEGGACQTAPATIDLVLVTPLIAIASVLPGIVGLVIVVRWARLRGRMSA